VDPAQLPAADNQNSPESDFTAQDTANDLEPSSTAPVSFEFTSHETSEVSPETGSDLTPTSQFEPVPTADLNPPDPEATQDEPAETTASGGEPLSFSSETEGFESFEAVPEENQPAEGGSDSLLDIFRAEDIEENPITGLAKTLDDVDIQFLLEKLRETADVLRGKTGA
jgi:hypothetical protein